MNELEIYEMVANEINSGKVRTGLWAKSFAECEGDENRTRALYMKLRVAQIVEASELERQATIEQARIEKELAETKKLKLLSENLKTEDDCLSALREHGYVVEKQFLRRAGTTMSQTNWKIILNKEGDYYRSNGLNDLKSKTIELLTPPSLLAKLPSDQSTEANSETESDTGKVLMFFGGFYFAVGALITLVTYSAASPGKLYILAWGAMVFGVIQFIRGLLKANSS